MNIKISTPQAMDKNGDGEVCLHPNIMFDVLYIICCVYILYCKSCRNVPNYKLDEQLKQGVHVICIFDEF